MCQTGDLSRQYSACAQRRDLEIDKTGLGDE